MPDTIQGRLPDTRGGGPSSQAFQMPVRVPARERRQMGEIHENGYWMDEQGNGHYHDTRLSRELARYFHGKTVLDMGCGKGHYVQHFRRLGITCDGCDGNPHTKAFDPSLHVIDLSKPFFMGTVYDWVLCLEVGEHLPAQYESVLLDNIDKHNKRGVILSWAIPGQGGHGHVNERSNDYIKKIMEARGYWCDNEWSTAFRGLSRLPWFKNTIMVFKRYSSR